MNKKYKLINAVCQVLSPDIFINKQNPPTKAGFVICQPGWPEFKLCFEGFKKHFQIGL